MSNKNKDQAADIKEQESAGTGLQVQDDPKTGTELTIYDFGDDAGAGMEDISKEERRIPFLGILQAGSPQCKPKNVGGPGLKPGDLYNSATGEAYDGEKGIDFIPVSRDHNFPEFIPRDEKGGGGGFVGIRSADDPTVAKLRAEQGKFGKLKTNNDDGEVTELVETYYIYGLVCPEGVDLKSEVLPGTVMPVVVGFKSTQIGKYQTFINRQDAISYQTQKNGATVNVKPPMWSHVWRLGTRYEEKKLGAFHGYTLSLREEPALKSFLRISHPLYQRAKAFYETVKSGKQKADFAAQATDSTDKDTEIPM